MPWNMHKMALFYDKMYTSCSTEQLRLFPGSSSILYFSPETGYSNHTVKTGFGGGFEVWWQSVNHRIDIDLIYFFQGNPAKLFRILICREKFFSFFATIFFVFMHIWLYFNGLINYKCELYYFSHFVRKLGNLISIWCSKNRKNDDCYPVAETLNI